MNNLYRLLLANLFEIRGRSSRKEYIFRFIMMWLCGLFAMYLIELDEKYNNNFFGYTSVIAGIFFIIYFFQVFFVTHRRLHDLNASGWWQLITFIPFGQLLT